MSNKNLTITINSGQDVPNQVQPQAGFQGQTENTQEASKGLSMSKTTTAFVAFGGAKIVTGLAQRQGLYTGNQVFQNNINRGVQAGTNMFKVGAMAFVNPGLGLAAVANEIIDTAFANADRALQIERTNDNAQFERDISNSNMNNGRYNGGQR